MFSGRVISIKNNEKVFKKEETKRSSPSSRKKYYNCFLSLSH
jgi:hypothetical protein